MPDADNRGANEEKEPEATRDCAADCPDHETIRRLADSVVWGECITFPNGLVVDKRVIPAPSIPWTPPPAATPAYPTTYPYPGNVMRGGCAACALSGNCNCVTNPGAPVVS